MRASFALLRQHNFWRKDEKNMMEIVSIYTLRSNMIKLSL